MNFTSVKSIEDEKRPADGDNSSIETTSTEEWPNSGGFPLIGDRLDEVRRRIDE